MDELLALDIGTGTVIGFLGRKKDGNLKVLARESMTYPERAIEEGRVVDMEAASRTVRQVVDRLQAAAKTTANVAHFAVPGRGLEIEEVEAEMHLETAREITSRDVENLFTGREEADISGAIIDENVLERRVDGDSVLRFEGQYGSRLKARWLIITLRPEEIENKKKVIEESDLVPGQLVLEPKAAVSAAFPDDEFKPRLGVIDFGAGTIDAAIIEDGQVRDFCTVLGSGDRLTRELENRLLADFGEAERVKQKLSARDEVSYSNLAGIEKTVDRSDLVNWLNPILREELRPLKKWFAKRKPRILFLAGGGSRYPNLSRLVSRTLDMEENNVVNRSPVLKSWVKDPEQLIGSPADYTAYGILLMAARDRGRYSLNLTVNGEPVQRLSPPGELKVGDLAEEMGYSPRSPHPDSAIMFSVDGEWITEKVEARLKPLVKINGEEVAYDTSIRSGDEVEIHPPDEPRPIRVRAGKYLPEEQLEIFWEGTAYQLPSLLLSDTNEKLAPETLLEDGREYERKLDYSRGEIRRELEQRGCEIPDNLLWKFRGEYTRRARFEVGERVELQAAVNPSLKGLGSLSSLPPNPRQPINQPLD